TNHKQKVRNYNKALHHNNMLHETPKKQLQSSWTPPMGSGGARIIIYEAQTPTRTPRHDTDTDTMTPLM
ncbi:hypothetical protein A2U01_0053097, partial [Trifolium medium]|nr:hypothetical protein [Trifolium medium]